VISSTTCRPPPPGSARIICREIRWAHERFDAEYLAGTEVDDGLVVQAELAKSDGADGIVFEGGAADEVVVDVRVEALVLALPAAFGHVHRKVGLTEEFGGILGLGAPPGHADADRDPQFDSADRKLGAHGVDNPLGDVAGRRVAVLFYGDGKLVAAEPDDEITGTDAIVESGRQLDKEMVAAFVTEGVVDLLEIVDIDEQHAVMESPALRAASERRHQSFAQGCPVGQSGERVVGGAPREGEMAVVEGARHAIERFDHPDASFPTLSRLVISNRLRATPSAGTLILSAELTSL
jgi:hypothetical protein